MRTFVSAFGKTDSKHTRGAVVQLVRMPACHAGGRGFESLPHRKKPRSNPGLLAMWKERFCKLKNLQNEPSTSAPPRGCQTSGLTGGLRRRKAALQRGFESFRTAN